MSERPLFDKMDALLKKHRGPGSVPLPTHRDASVAPAAPSASAVPVVEPVKPPPPRRAPPVGAWLPVLTDVIEPGTKGIASLLSSEPFGSATAAAPLAGADTRTMVDSQLAGQLLAELAPRLSEAMKKQVAEELRRSLDQTVAQLLERLDVSVRDLAREALAEKLRNSDTPK